MMIQVQKINTDEISEYPVSSDYQILLAEDFIKDLFDILEYEYEIREIQGSGWTFLHTKYLTISINKYVSLSGSSYIELPDLIKNKKAVINLIKISVWLQFGLSCCPN